MSDPKLTRAERKAKRAGIIASQKAAKEEALLDAKEESKKKSFRKNVIIFCTLLVTMPLLAYGILSLGDSVTERKAAINELAVANYQVQDAAQTRTTSFTGDDITVSVNGKIHTCRGLHAEDLAAKKPFTCEDGTVIQPKP